MAFVKDKDIFGISPERLPVVLKAHLSSLRSQLLDRSNVALCRRFEQRFDAGFAQENQGGSLWKRRLKSLLACLRRDA
jgi:hypothetical protein